MAGIGIKLQKIYEKKTILAYLTGFGYSAVVTVAPMFVVIGTIMLMSQLLGYENVGYARRGLFSGTLLYIFIFSLLTAAPFNAVLSRYMSDVIYEERYEDILPCYDVGLLLNILLASLLGIPFCAWEHLVGHVNLIFVFTGFCGYIALVLVRSSRRCMLKTGSSGTTNWCFSKKDSLVSRSFKCRVCMDTSASASRV